MYNKENRKDSPSPNRKDITTMKHLSTLCLSLLLTATLSACATTDNTQATTDTSQSSTDTSLDNTPSTPDSEQTTSESQESQESQESKEQQDPIFLSGEALTLDSFAPYDITAINVWATWCGPCVDEMPHLQELYTLLPDNMNFITVCHDGETQEATALNILRGSNAQFQNYYPDENLSKTLIPKIVAFPTTFFVDKEGNLVGDAFRGAPSKEVAQTYLTLMNNALALVSE